MKLSIHNKPALYGLQKSNRDFTKEKSWGKNIFNNAFPIALACYMDTRAIEPIYLQFDKDMALSHATIPVATLFGKKPDDETTFFAFESDFVPYRSLVIGNLPRADIVIQDEKSGQCTSGLEIKLTALPDNSTYKLGDERFGCELVIRPDTIVYLALSIAREFKHKPRTLQSQLEMISHISDWTDIAEVAPYIPQMARVLDDLLQSNLHLQRPLVLQPVWKTIGRTLQLHSDAFDIFVWSDFAFTRLFFRDAHNIKGKPSRSARSIAWLAKMLLDFAANGKIDHHWVVDNMSFNTKNDKAFAVNGRVTQPYMACTELEEPRIKKDEIRHIILHGGQNFLSPERRLDAALLSTLGLFD
ncbi:MAG: HindVP family restriction endonuclease [Anaerolineae bacterium]|nr:HindVP family restriction endonuclease [Anaerolineae bacterium]MDQ7033923.1 HindVP family restriction endonuclease [Anaerolineae bacterium]